MTDGIHIFLVKLKAFFMQSADDAAFNEEIEAHLEMLVERYERQGMGSAEAKRTAGRQFGNVSLLTQQRKEARTTMFFYNIARELRYGVRQLVKTPVGVEKVSTNWLIFMKSVWQCEAFSGIV
jgi:hypothetical protein